ncbi:MAG: hypothetical protein AAFY50_07125 [Cyanobacteria bacterium J06648_1]
MNTKLVESIYLVIQSLSDEERCLRLASRSLLEEKLYTNLPYPSQEEIIALAETSNVFDFLHDEPDIYTLENGEVI